MNYVRRNESFRYTFYKPIKGQFQLARINGKHVESKTGEMNIIDLSVKGMKMSTDLDIPIRGKEIEVMLNFTIMSAGIYIPGKLLWQKAYAGQFLYGIQMDSNDTLQEQIIQDLKAYSKQLNV